MKTRREIIDKVVIDCLNEIFMAAQPSVTFDEVQNIYKRTRDRNIIQHYYIDENEMGEIIESYVEAYNIKSHWNDDVDVVLNYLSNGGTKDKYIKPDDGSPGYRGYEKTPKLQDIIGEENAKLTIDLINDCKYFYKFDNELERFRFNIFNYSPNNDINEVREYWKDKCIKIYKKVYNDETGEYELIE